MQDKKVLIYTLPTCHFCQQAKEYFKEKGIEYEEKDVSSDEAAQKEMVDKSGAFATPVIDIGGKIIIGFRPDKINESIGLS
jgi:glutaredoxin-like YruB-family protein